MSALRVYVPGEDEFGADGYPVAWHTIKHHVREQAGHRCVRCGHPYRNGEHGSGEWSLCDDWCEHVGPWRIVHDGGRYEATYTEARVVADALGIIGEHPSWRNAYCEALWRILTVHHLTGDKADCRWWNLAALCQRCHLEIQGRTKMDQVYPFEHSEWFKPYAAGFYAPRYLGEDLSREQTMARLDELLGLERVA